MKTKKKESAPSRFTRGEKVGTKSSRRHARKPAGMRSSKKEEEFTRKLEELTPM